MSLVGNIFREWISWIYPSICELCGCRCDYGQSLCPDCIQKLEKIEPPYCAICGAPVPGSFIPTGICNDCHEQKPHYSEARAVFTNANELRELILSFKYAGKIYLGRTLATLMVEAIKSHPYWFDGEKCHIIPVPMNSKKLYQRGYNQAAELAKQVAKNLNWSYSDILIHKEDNQAQAGLGRVARLKHAKKVYRIGMKSLKEKSFEGESVLLIDDVFTTGATADSCARWIKRAGAKNVYVFTLARTVSHYK